MPSSMKVDTSLISSYYYVVKFWAHAVFNRGVCDVGGEAS